MTPVALVTERVFHCHSVEETTSQGGTRRSLFLAGEFDGAAAVALDAAATDLDLPDELVVDLADVTFVDSMGVRVLVRWRRAAVDAERSMRIERPSAAVRRLLDAASLSEYFGISPG